MVVADLESSRVDSKLARGRLWLELSDWNADAPAEVADRLSVGLKTMQHERWLAARFPDGSPRSWLTWRALRDLAPLSDDAIAGIIMDAEAADQRTGEHVSTLARQEKARQKAGGVDPALAPDADPITAATRAAYFAARALAEFGADFEPETCGRIAAWAEREAVAWETAATATIEAVFGPGPGARVGVEA